VLVVNFLDRADVGMIQSRSSLASPAAAQGFGVRGCILGQELEGNKPAELHIHPAAMRDGLADHLIADHLIM
jgi:hypothetical protein